MSKDTYPTRLTLLLFLGWAVMYANRSALPALLAALASDWGLSRTQLGLINSAFFLTYAAVQLPAGLLSDRLRPRAVMLAGYGLQATSAVAAALTGGPVALGCWRALAGLGQGSYYSSQYALATAALPPDRRGAGLAFINSGMAVGTIAGLALGGYLTYTLGWSWRYTLVLLGLAGLVVAGAMARLVQAAPAATVGGGSARPGRELAYAAGAAFCTMYGLYTLLTWTPYYLQEAQGLPGQTAAVGSMLVPAFAVPAGLAAGWASDRLGRRPVLLGLIPLAGAAVLLTARPSLYWVLGGLALYGVAGKLVIDPLLVAVVAETTPAGARGRAFGLLNLASAAAAAAAPALSGYLADRSGSFAGGLVLAGWLHLPAWVLLWQIGRHSHARRSGALRAGTGGDYG